jgi:alpha-L-fucosidase 2
MQTRNAACKYALCVAAMLCSRLFGQAPTDLTLWYTKPAGVSWESALPLGNGRLGAMVYGNVATEILQLNEHTLWSGGPNRNDNPLALDSLVLIRRLLFEGKHKEAERTAGRTIISKTSQGQMFLPAGELRLHFKDHERYTDYRRELDLATAVSSVSYRVGETRFTRRTIASFPDQVIAVHLSASSQRSISFTISYRALLPSSTITTSGDGKLMLDGTGTSHEGVAGIIRYRMLSAVRAFGGTRSQTDSSLTITNADSATVYISIATSFNNYLDASGDPQQRAAAYLAPALGKPFSAVLRSHILAYRHYFDRVRVNLGENKVSDLPTDERLKKFGSWNDPAFAALYYQYGRYLLISSSQPGGQPANLQGIWNNKTRPPWDSKYTININAEMNYWPAEKTSLAELHEPFLRMVRELSVTGVQTAKSMYGTRGWMAHHNTDIWRATGAVDGAFWGAWINGGGWTSQHLWEHYLYSGDRKFLSSIYEILKGAALFYLDFLIRDPRSGWLVTAPDMSPENAPAAHGGSSLDIGVTMTNQIIFDVFTTAIKAANLLGVDRKFSDSLATARNSLPPMHIGKHGQLQEWLEDIDDPKDNHRHISHLYGLFPSSQISAYRTPELYSAARTTLLQRGDVSTGWSMGWKVNWWARLLDGNHAYKLIQDQLTPVGQNTGGGGTYENLFDAHPPFQIDGNFGCTSGMSEMLMQSADECIHLLPALPDAWNTGYISGLRAKGGFEIVSITWKNSRLVSAEIRSTLGGNLRLRSPELLQTVKGTVMKIASGKNSNPFYQEEEPGRPIVSKTATVQLPVVKRTYVYDIPTSKGQRIKLIAKGN